MTSIKLYITGAKAKAEVEGVLTSGTVGIPVTIEYDSAWDGLTKDLICTSGKWGPTGAPRTTLNIDSSATVAHEVMIADNHLYLGVAGYNSDGTLVIHTVWADCGMIFAGCNTNATPSAKPTLPIWSQLQQQINDLKESSASGGIGEDGGYYIPSVSQPDDKTVQFDFTPNEEEMPAVEPIQVTLPVSDHSQLTAENESPVFGAELASASGWTSDGWTGDFSSGFTHTSGNTNALSFAIPGIAVGKAYVIEFDCSVSYTNTNLLVTIGAASAMLLYGVECTNTKVGVIAVDTGALTFTPESAFAGKISNISIREITAASTPRQSIKASTGNVVNETRHGGESLFMGVGVGGKTVDGNGNYAIGDSTTFQNNISGFWNVAIGRKCMGANVSGSRNVSIGANNLNANEAGTRNVSVGNYCMMQAKNPNRTVAIGADCMSTATGGDDTVAIGFQALYANTTGKQNVAIGSGVLQQNTTGLGNVAIGYTALSKNTTGRSNIAIGFGAGKSLTSGNGNIIIGANADVSADSYYALNIGNLLKGSVQSGSAYLSVNGGLRLPSIGTAQTSNNDVYAEEWTFTLEDDTTVTKKVLLV